MMLTIRGETATVSVILSRASPPAADHKVADPTITRQMAGR